MAQVLRLHALSKYWRRRQASCQLPLHEWRDLDSLPYISLPTLNLRYMQTHQPCKSTCAAVPKNVAEHRTPRKHEGNMHRTSLPMKRWLRCRATHHACKCSSHPCLLRVPQQERRLHSQFQAEPSAATVLPKLAAKHCAAAPQRWQGWHAPSCYPSTEYQLTRPNQLAWMPGGG
jgi:hypothetical protein